MHENDTVTFEDEDGTFEVPLSALEEMDRDSEEHDKRIKESEALDDDDAWLFTEED